MFEAGNRAAAGVHNRGDKQRWRAYSDAVRQLLDAPSNPPGWDPDPKNWTTAQRMAENHVLLARGGDMEAAKMVIDRSEGKVPMAPEDREAAQGAAALDAFAGAAALNALRTALGMRPVVDVTPVEKPALPAKGKP